jgi:DNA repair photolyase
VEIVQTSRESIIQPCNLAYFKHELGPYVGCEHRCLYCYTQNAAAIDWDTQVAVFPDFRRRIGDELGAIEPEIVFIGMDTDPYQPAEAGYRHTRITLDEMFRRGFSASILTKSGMVTQDLDLLSRMSEPEVGVSISFADERARRVFEPYAPPTEARILALQQAMSAGIKTYVLISPVLPLITDVGALIDMVGSVADTIWVYSLNVESAEDRNWRRVDAVLSKHFPAIRDEFTEIAFSPDHAYWLDLRRKLEMASQGDIKIEIHV